MDKHALKIMENHAILSLEFNVQHWMEQIFNLEAIALHKTVKPALKMLDNYAIILDNWIGAILRIKQVNSIVLLKMVYLALIAWPNIALLSMDTTALLNLFRITKEHIAGLTVHQCAQKPM